MGYDVNFLMKLRKKGKKKKKLTNFTDDPVNQVPCELRRKPDGQPLELYIYYSTRRIRCMNSASFLIFCKFT
jgi:hypothetical protein